MKAFSAFFIAVLLAVSGCAKTGAFSGARESDPAPDSVVYLDVRRPDEFAAGHVRGALLIPHDQLETRWTELQEYRDQRIVLYCRSGRRAGIADSLLRTKGFTRLENAGGLVDLQEQGVPVVLKREYLEVPADTVKRN